MKHFITLFTLLAITFIFTLTSFAGDKNKCFNGNHYAYGHKHHKKQIVNCKLDEELVSLIVEQAVRNALDEAEADRLMMQTSNSLNTQTADFGEEKEIAFTEYVMEPRRVMIHKIRDDATFNAGYAGVDIIYYSKDQQVINEVLNSVDENYDVTVVVKTASGKEIHFTSNVNMESIEKDGWDKFVTIAN